MATKKWILALLVGMISLLTACSSPNTFSPQNQSGPSSQSNVSISVSTTLPTPPATLSVLPASLPTLSVKVSNDPDTTSGGAGVNWVLAICQSSYTNCNPSPCAGGAVTCGYLYVQGDQAKTPVTHSSDQATLVYQPPTTFPTAGNNMYVQILAIALADQTKNTVNTVQVSGFASVLQAGTYVLHAEGNGGGSPYQVAGAITVDGNGNITAGHQTLNLGFSSEDEDSTQINPDVSQPNCTQSPAPASCYFFYGSGYFVGPDGRGSLILGNMDQVGSLVNETFGLVVLSSTKALISELDSNSGVGTLELQDATAAAALPTGVYSMVAGGTDSGGTPIAFGAILNIDNQQGPGTISGTGSLGLQDYINNGSSTCPAPHAFTGSSVSQVTNFAVGGVVNFSFVATCTGAGFLPFQVTGYIVDQSHMMLIETDDGYFTAGIAMPQSSAPGSFNLGSFSGQYVYAIRGIEGISFPPSSFISGTVVCPDGAGSLDSCNGAGGYTDSLFLETNAAYPGGQNNPYCPFDFSSCPGAVSANLSGNYQIDTKGIGRIDLTGLKFNPQPNPIYPLAPRVHFLLTGPLGAPALVIYAGGEDKWYPALGVGVAYPQPTPANALTFGNPETYGVSFAQSQLGQVENDGTGWMIANPPSTYVPPPCLESQITSPSPLEGCVDDFVTVPSVGFGAPAALSSTFTTSTPPADDFGRVSGSFFTVLNTSNPALNAAGTYYFVSPDQGFFVETDLVSNFEAGNPPQASIGYFAKSCDVTGQNPNLSCSSSAGSSSKRAVKRTQHRGGMK